MVFVDAARFIEHEPLLCMLNVYRRSSCAQPIVYLWSWIFTSWPGTPGSFFFVSVRVGREPNGLVENPYIYMMDCLSH